MSPRRGRPRPAGRPPPTAARRRARGGSARAGRGEPGGEQGGMRWLVLLLVLGAGAGAYWWALPAAGVRVPWWGVVLFNLATLPLLLWALAGGDRRADPPDSPGPGPTGNQGR